MSSQAQSDEIEDLRTMLTGAYNQISELKNRVEQLEEEKAEIESELQMVRREVAETGLEGKDEF